MSNQSVTRATSSTLIDILGTVGTTANTVTRTVQAAAISVDMLNAFAIKARNEQIIRYREEETKLETLIPLQVAAEIAVEKHRIFTEVSQNPELEKLFHAELKRIQDRTQAAPKP